MNRFLAKLAQELNPIIGEVGGPTRQRPIYTTRSNRQVNKESISRYTESLKPTPPDTTFVVKQLARK